MALTPAEKQRQYRTRRNRDPEKRANYLSKQKNRYRKDRQEGKRKSIQELLQRDALKQRKEWRLYKRSKREREKALKIETPSNAPTITITYTTAPIVCNETNSSGQNTPVSSTRDDIIQLPCLRDEPMQHMTSVKHLKYSLVPRHLQSIGQSLGPVQSHTQVKEEPVEHWAVTGTSGQHFEQNGEIVKIKSLALTGKTTLGSARPLIVTRESLVDDVFRFYREDPGVVEDDVSVFIQNSRTGSTEEADINSVFTEFWRRVCKTCFEGDKEVVPKLSPLQDSDTFRILGRILAHGLILMNYWALRLSRACAVMILTGRDASDDFLISSFRSVLSKTERGVVDDLEKKVKNCEGYDSPANMALAAKALAPYGCTQLPPAEKLGLFLRQTAIQHCQCRPYWPLMQMHTGFTNSSNISLIDITEADVNIYYDSLVPTSTSLISKITYSYSDNDKTASFEKSVTSFLEKVLFKLTKVQLQRLLLLWCGSDCLNSDFLFVMFNDTSQVSPPTFDRAVCEMCLNRFFPSAEVLQEYLENCLEESVSFRG